MVEKSPAEAGALLVVEHLGPDARGLRPEA
jgi:hypothetical protein